MNACHRSAVLSFLASSWFYVVFFIMVCLFSAYAMPLSASGAGNMDLVFLIDVSGSMVRTDPGYLLKDAVVQCTGNLACGECRVAVVPFSDKLGQEYPLTVFHGQEDVFLTYMKGITYTNGDTDIGKALSRAVEILTGRGEDGLSRDRRIILITDGVIDLPHTEDEMAAEKGSLTAALMAAEKARDGGIVIDTAGIGDARQTDENLLGYLADRTGGIFAGTVQGDFLDEVLPLMVKEERTPDSGETKETEKDTEAGIIPGAEETEAGIWPETEPYTEEDFFYAAVETESESEMEAEFPEKEQKAYPDRGGPSGKELPVSLSGVLIVLMSVLFLTVLFFRGGASSGDSRISVHARRPGAEGESRRGGILRFYVKMENQKIFGVPTQNMTELPETGKVRLSELLDDPYLETARTDRVLLRITKDGPVLQSRTDECLIRDESGNTKKILNLSDGCRFRIFCATDTGTAVIVAVYSTKNHRGSRSTPNEEEKTRLLV